MELLGGHARATDALLCIHNQESAHENTLYMDGTGPLRELYAGFGDDLNFFTPTKTNSMEAVLSSLGADVSVLLVHNTYTTNADLSRVSDYNSQVSYCLCPNANLYIENRMPDIELLAETDNLMVLGTDSLASNWTLSILDEMKTIAASYPGIQLSTLISWATYNGAKLLGLDSELGSFEKGKRPGINLIYDVDMDSMALLPHSKIRVLA
jgi:cytosine/adenosine deaminase-related metal-dependent hydrolase